MKRVVITGATGFIGAHLLQRLRRDGLGGERVELVAIARRVPADAAAEVQWHALDLATASVEAVAAACGPSATIVHLAANASVRSGQAGYDNNVRSTTTLIEAARRTSAQRLVYASSIGAVDRVPSDDCRAPLTEASTPHPLTMYGRGKLAGERLVAESGVPFSIVRPTWVYGPGMRAESHLRALLAMVRRGGPAARFDFPGRVSLVHVDDLCMALELAATHPQAVGRTFFATDGAPVSLGTILREMGELTARSAAGWRVPSFAIGVARRLRPLLPLGVQNLCSDVLLADDAALRTLGYASRVSRRAGLLELARAESAPAGRCIVTGAASGIGRAMAEQLHVAGHAVVAVDRDAAGLALLAADCAGVETVVADLATDEGRAAVRAAIDAAPLQGLVNCAGIGTRGAVAESDRTAEQRVLAVNVAALLDAASHALPRLATGGWIVNIASSAALQPLPGMATYAASKAFVLSWSEAVAVESAGRVAVITICPGGTDTGFQSAAGVKRAAGEVLMPPARVAAAALRAIARGRSATVFVGPRVHVMGLMARVLPRTTIARLWGRAMASLR